MRQRTSAVRRSIPAVRLRSLGSWCLCLSALGGAPAGGAAPDFHYRVWTNEDGLPAISVRDAAQTQDGYLWIATLDGLVRFDGVRMQLFQRSEIPEMTSNRCLSLLVDREGTLWVGTEDGGALQVRGTDVRAFGLEGPSNKIVPLEQDSRGRIWADGGSGLAVVFEGGRWTTPGPYARRDLTHRGPQGILQAIEDGRVVDYDVPVGKEMLQWQFWLDPGHARWISTGPGSALRLRDGKVEPVQWPAVPREKRQAQDWTRIFEGRQGRLWVLEDGYLHLREGGTWRTYPTPFPVALLPRPSFLFEDREGTLWIGGDGGLVQATPTAVRALVPEGVKRDTIVYSLAEGPPGRVWVTTLSEAFVWERGVFTPLTGKPWWPPGWVTAVEPDVDGTLLVGSGNGIFRVWPGRRFEKIRAFGGEYRDFVRDRAGTVWAVNERGLARSTGTDWIPVTPLPSSDVKVLLEGRDGAMWVGSSGGLTRFSPDGARTWTTADGLSSDRIRCLHEDAEGRLWIGTYDGGLNRFAGGRFTAVRKKDGLFDDGVFAILDDGNGLFWMSSNRGVFAVAKSELEAFASGRTRRVSYRAWRRTDGMPSSECNGGRQPSGFRAADGTLWFPTQGGIAVFDPRAVEAPGPPPPVVIEEVTTDRRSIPLRGDVVVEPGERRLEVRYTANTFVHPEGVRFRYRLVGFDPDWVEAGGRRFAQYTSVPPGRYALRVAAANSDGAWSEEVALPLRVRPAWWQTMWFRSGAAIVAAGLIGTGYRRRVSRLNRRRAEQDAFARRLLESQEAERKRIAAELHDGIGQTMVAIRNRARLGMRPGMDPRRQIEEISAVAGDGIEEVRKIAYGLRPYQLDRLGLRRALLAVIEQTAASSAIPIAAEVGEVDGAFRKEDEINVYRIVQEGLSNLVKHAGAGRGRVTVAARASAVEIMIEDDGAGFDAAALAAAGGGGLGLSGIAERARILGGRSTVRSVPGQGTTVTVLLPRGAAS